MGYLKENAIVLRQTTVRRGDRWYTLLCSVAGKLDVLVRSAASSKSKLAGHLSVGSKVAVMLAPGKSIIHLAGVKRLHNYHRPDQELASLLLRWSLLHRTDRLLFGNENINDIYPVLDDVLSVLSDMSVSKQWQLADIYLAHLLGAVGLAPDFKTAGHYFSLGQARSSRQVDDWPQLLSSETMTAAAYWFSPAHNWPDKIVYWQKISKPKGLFAQFHSLVDNYYRYQTS
ncbi:MAG: DNA repair protein RecO [Candidatus Komeilibacteria bacterium]